MKEVHRHVSRHYGQVSNVPDSINNSVFVPPGGQAEPWTRVQSVHKVSNVVENKRKWPIRHLESLQKKRKYQRKENTGKLSLKSFPYPVEREPSLPLSRQPSREEILQAYHHGKAGTSAPETAIGDLAYAYQRGQLDAMRAKRNPESARCR